MEDRNCWSSRQFVLKGLRTDLLRLTGSELQHGAGRLKGTKDILGETELSSIRARVGGTALCQIEAMAAATIP